MNIELIEKLVFWFSMFLRFLSLLLIFFFVIPLQIKEVRVKNGLSVLRHQLLYYGVSLFFIISLSMPLLILREYFDNEVARNFATFLTLTNSVLFTFLAITGHRIYTQNYTAEKKAMHARFEKFEKAEEKKVLEKKR